MAPIACREIQPTFNSEEQNKTENKKPAVILSTFRHLIQQNNQILHDDSKFFSVRSYDGIAT